MAFSFGNTGASKPGFSFGSSTATTKATGTVQPFGFGNATTSSAPSASTGFSFGNTSSQPAKTTSSSLFGASANTTTSTGLGGSGFGGGFKLGGSTATTASGFLFGGNTGLSLGNTGGSLTATSTTGSAFGTSAATTSAPAFRGLGGVSSTASTSNQSDGNGNKNNGVGQALKEQQVPDELCKDVKDFENFVKKQKEGSNTIGKFSIRSLRKIQEEVSSLSYALGSVSSALHRNNAAVQKLRSDFTEELRYIEIAKHTQDIPPSLQHDNIAPIKFFMNMLSEFESSMQIYRKQIEELENHLSLTDQSINLTPQDIYVALCKMQESFIALAANLHSIHDQVKILKEQYLVYRRIVHNDTFDIFAANKQKLTQEKSQKTSGLSPFNQLSNVAALAMASMVNQQSQQQQGPPQQGHLSTQPAGGTGLFGGANKPIGTASLFGGGSTTTGSKFGGFSGFGSTTKPLSAGFGTSATQSTGLFGNTSSLNTSAGLTFGGSAATGSTFELKRPPLGNKRGKK
uniref:nucleoporin p58/p45-like n=1 Tax=Styela clava TaxID=7725 RepID=UPI00193A53B4|nr:nucleoporin p58/p45-like [Styela clava]